MVFKKVKDFFMEDAEKKENLIITIDILSKRKYDHAWQKKNIGEVLTSFAGRYFDDIIVVYFEDKGLFTGFEIVLGGSKFKLNKIEDNTVFEQFMHRYEGFLPHFIESMIGLLKGLKLKFEIHRMQHLESSLLEYTKFRVEEKIKRENETTTSKGEEK